MSGSRRGASPREGWVAGFHAVLSALRAGSVREVRLQVGRRDARAYEIEGMAREQGIAVRRIPAEQMDRLGLGAHQGVAAELRSQGNEADEGDLETLLDEARTAGRSALLLVLDGVTDPRNLGACLRSADAAGVDAVVVPRSRTAPLNAAARKTASGAAETVPLIPVANLARSLQWLKQRGLAIVGFAGEGESAPWQVDLTAGTALVLGAEGAGLRQLTRRHCDQLVALPMAGSVESLNVSVAAGIALFEVVRQRSSPT